MSPLSRQSSMLAFMIALLAAPLPASNCDAALCASGFVSLRGMRTESATTWLRGGYGRLSTGDGQHSLDTSVEESADLVGEWKPSTRWMARVHVVARDDSAGTDAGITEAFLQGRFMTGGALRLRAGMFFPGTSLENRGEGWSSPYTLTLSAINTWIAEEVRPIGLDGEYRLEAGKNRLAVGTTLFGGMDTAGTLLAWRGWSFGNRTTRLNETLPLPPLPSLSDPEQFGRQRSGTKPFGGDLDGRPGWSARARWEVERASVQFTRLDNEGDRQLYDGQYSWRTKASFWSGEFQLPGRAVAIAEFVQGSTGMGAPPSFVQADIEAGYVMLSVKPARARFSVRYDLFRTDDRDHSGAETNTENGHAWTAACIVSLREDFELGAEYIGVDSRRQAIEDHPALDSRCATVGLRYLF